MDDDSEAQSLFENRDIPQSTLYKEKRLDYRKPVYRDIWCAIIYYLVLAGIIGFTVWIWVAKWPEIEQHNESITENVSTITDTALATQSWANDVDLTGVYVALISCVFIGLLFGFIWLCILRACAKFIIKVMLFLSIILWIAITALAFYQNETELGIILAICTLIIILYTWCVWGRIRFASVLLALGSKIVSTFSGVVCVQFTVVIFSIIWFAVIGMCLYGYFIITGGQQGTDADGNIIYEYAPNGWVIFGLILSLYWSLEVNSNISHTTACGVSAVWYFTPRDVSIRKPTYKAFNRSMTTSFGSICMGSLIVAILEMIRSMVNAAAQQNNNLCLICVRSCLGCIEACIRWFNKYAYAHCAIYGVSFMKAAQQTWQLFERQGIMALINDDLSGLGLFAGSLCSLVVCGGSGYGIAYSFYGSDANEEVSSSLVWGLAVYGAIVGFILCWLVLIVVRSAIVTLFVCFAEEPAILYANRREAFNELVGVKPKFQEIHDNLASAQSV